VGVEGSRGNEKKIKNLKERDRKIER